MQVHASAAQLRLITFDADGTLYADGCHMEQDNRMIDAMIELMSKRIHVAIVTAAGYPGEPHLFENRIQGLLGAFRARRLSDEVTSRFLMLGGECNYLLRCAVSRISAILTLLLECNPMLLIPALVI
jgi:IMP and pyridine-specific 5'-nucleotidase